MLEQARQLGQPLLQSSTALQCYIVGQDILQSGAGNLLQSEAINITMWSRYLITQ